jgi:hypothetical protein
MRITTWLTRATVALGATAIASLCGCDGRVSQCNRLIQVINTEQEPLKGTAGAEPAALRKLADVLEELASKVEGVEIADEKLVQFRTDYAAMVRELGAVSRQTATHLESDDPSKATESAKQMSTFGARETELVENINQYCTGGGQ